MQIHYHRNGKTEKDKTTIGVYFAKKPVERQHQGGVLVAPFFAIPKDAADFVVKGSSAALEDFTLDSIMPHMHMLGKGIKVMMTPPEGKSELLLEIREWDYNWQETYYLKQPIKVKAGTRLDVEATYDNSSSNPSNPFSPSQIVLFGEQTTNEMCFVFLGGTSDKPGNQLPIRFRVGNKGAK
jgi:hypothetical protein